jgi:hypothetical protein
MIVTPEPGSEKFVARALLDLADNPSQVQTVTNPNIAFRVPVELFRRFELAMGAEQTDVESAPKVKPKKSAGRPKKEEGQ